MPSTDFIPLNLTDSEILQYFKSEFGGDLAVKFSDFRSSVCDSFIVGQEDRSVLAIDKAEALQLEFIRGSSRMSSAEFSSAVGKAFGHSGTDYRMTMMGIEGDSASPAMVSGIRMMVGIEQELVVRCGFADSKGMVKIYRKIPNRVKVGRTVRISGGFCDIWSFNPFMEGSGSLVASEVHYSKIVSSCLGRIGSEDSHSKSWPYLSPADVLICSPVTYGVVVSGEMSTISFNIGFTRISAFYLATRLKMRTRNSIILLSDLDMSRQLVSRIDPKAIVSRVAEYRKWFGHPSQAVSLREELIAMVFSKLR
jgi:hypothetical protein